MCRSTCILTSTVYIYRLHLPCLKQSKINKGPYLISIDHCPAVNDADSNTHPAGNTLRSSSFGQAPHQQTDHHVELHFQRNGPRPLQAHVLQVPHVVEKQCRSPPVRTADHGLERCGCDHCIEKKREQQQKVQSWPDTEKTSVEESAQSHTSCTSMLLTNQHARNEKATDGEKAVDRITAVVNESTPPCGLQKRQ